MKILITGANGLLGQNAVKQFVNEGYEVFATGRGPSRLPSFDRAYTYLDIELTDANRIFREVVSIRPDVILHTAAMAQPDDCELNRTACYDSNVNATRYLTEVAGTIDARLVFLSTDFIFSGENGPYEEEDIPAPVNYYGQTKWEAEQYVMQGKMSWAIVRTVLVYGNILQGTRSNIVTWVKENLEKKRHIKVVSDQVRTPTFVEDLAHGIQLIIEKEKKGIYHISGKEVLTPFDIAIQVADYFGLDKSLMERVNADTFTQPARRPLKTGFLIDKAERELGYQPVSFVEGIRRIYG